MGTIIIPISQVWKLRLRITHLLQVSQLVLSHSLTHSFISAPPYAPHWSRCQQVTEQEYELNSGPMFFTTMTLFLPKHCSDSLQTVEAVYSDTAEDAGRKEASLHGASACGDLWACRGHPWVWRHEEGPLQSSRMVTPGAAGTTPTKAGRTGIEERRESLFKPVHLPGTPLPLPSSLLPSWLFPAPFHVLSLLPSSAPPSLFHFSLDLLSSGSLARCSRRSGFLGACLLGAPLLWEDAHRFGPTPEPQDRS